MAIYFARKCNAGGKKSSSKGYRGPVECLPELIAACEWREDIFHSIVAEELQPTQISQVTCFFNLIFVFIFVVLFICVFLFKL